MVADFVHAEAVANAQRLLLIGMANTSEKNHAKLYR
jgi:hypothetical protein